MRFVWDITVLKYDEYGKAVIKKTPMSVFAANKDEVTEKVRAVFQSTYDDFRHFWSHGWTLRSVTEVDPPESNEALDSPRYIKGIE